MTTQGIEAVFLETHNWGKAAKFFQGLGYEIEFATDHNSGQLRNGNGPYLFIAEVPESQPVNRHTVLAVADADDVPARPGRRGGQCLGGHPLGHQADDRPRSRRPRMEAAGASEISEQ